MLGKLGESMHNVRRRHVLLLGGRSFIGGHICRALVAEGYRVLLQSSGSTNFENLSDFLPHDDVDTVVFPLSDTGRLEEILHSCNLVVHAAMPYHKQSIGRLRVRQQQLSEFDSVLQVFTASGVEKAVFISVSGAIGKVDGVADESCHGAKWRSWGHLNQKICSERMILQHVENGLNAIIVNPSMCVGPYDSKPSTGEFFRFFERAPFYVMTDEVLNIVDVEDVAFGVVYALERGAHGERYILSGTNTTVGEFIRRIKTLSGKKMPRFSVPRHAVVCMGFLSEMANMVLRRSAPLVPLIGIEVLEQGAQRLSCAKAMRVLGYAPRDAWTAVDRAYYWYKEKGLL